MDLYQELILEHSKRPHHAGLRDPFDAEVHHINPTCGDEVTLRVDVTGAGADAVVRDVSYVAQGCSISSRERLGARRRGHRPTRERGPRDLRGDARDAHLQGQGPGDETVIGDGVALSGVSKYPARVKCALLGWTAFTDALARSGVDISPTTTDSTPRQGVSS